MASFNKVIGEVKIMGAEDARRRNPRMTSIRGCIQW